jgi:multiple sugar transport system substrate-binding protein
MIKTFGDDVDAFIFPKGPGQWTMMSDTDNVMFESCKNKEAAFEWLAYLAAGKGEEKWCTVTGNLPVSKNIQQLPFFQQNRFIKVSLGGTPVAGPMPNLPATPEFIGVIWPNTLGAALTGKIGAQEAMQTMQKGLHEQ